jgi:HSP20 family protein
MPMALIRRERERDWPQAYDRDLLEWPFQAMNAWSRLFEDDRLNVEEYEENGSLVVRAELPGIDPDRDVDISVAEGNLLIRAERRHEEKVEQRNYRRTEIRYGSFSRVLPLPTTAKEEDIQATYKDGILEVRAPIEQTPATPSKIEVRRS